MKSSKKSKKGKITEEVDESQLQEDYSVKPSNEGPKIDSSDWPLLLKVKKKSERVYFPREKKINLMISILYEGI